MNWLIKKFPHNFLWKKDGHASCQENFSNLRKKGEIYSFFTIF